MMAQQQHERTTTMNTSALMRTASAAVFAVLAVFGAFADDPVYITGAEYTIEDGRLTVTSGEGTLVQQTPASISSICVTNGASLKIGIDDPFATAPYLYLYGKKRETAGCDFATFDLNGHSVEVLLCDNRWTGQGVITNNTPPHPGPGRVINTSQTAASFRMTGGNTYFYGNFEELPGKISVTASNPNLYICPTATEHPASSFTVADNAQLQLLDRPQQVLFVFDPPAGNSKGAVRFAELSPTSEGVPAAVDQVAASSVSTVADYNDIASLTDNRSDTVYGTSAGTVHSFKMTVSGYPAIDGYRIAPYGTPINTYTTGGWKVYVYRHQYIGWILVDERSGDDLPWLTNTSQTSTTNILFSANSRMGSLLGPNTELAVSSSKSPNVRISLSAAESVASLSGAAAKTIRLEDNSMFTVADVSAFSGSFLANGESMEQQGRLALVAGESSERSISIANGQNIAVLNGGTDDVSVLLDDSRTDNLFGQMKDGASGRLGLVKRDAGERIVETEGSSYTGPTAVHGGTLTVAKRRGAPYSARYIKFTPVEVIGTDTTAAWGMNEFRIFNASGETVPWPNVTTVTSPGEQYSKSYSLTNIIDNVTSTRMLMKPYSGGYAPVVIDTKTGVTFASYEWWSPHGHSADKNRTPVKWTVEVSNDNTAWTVCDCGEWGWTSADDAAATAGWTGSNSVMRGPFMATGLARSEGTALYTLDSAFFGEGSAVAARDTYRPLKARYFRLRVYETQNPNAGSNAYGWQMAEFSLWKDGSRLLWPITTAEPALVGSTIMTSHNSALTNLVNNIIWAEGEAYLAEGGPEPERLVVNRLPSYVTIDAGQELEFDSYSFTTTGNHGNQNDRLPKAWRLEISLDGSDFATIDDVGAYVPPAEVLATPYQTVGPFPLSSKFPYLDTSAANSIGDASPVEIDAGAALKIDADYEKFGPLSGAGSLDLVWNAVGEINVCAPATFSGSVTGDGTLAVCGDSVQTFDGATLSGVKTLELNGGAIAGTASFGGNDVTVAFNGGATGATLSGIGTLTVTGDVKYALPDVTGMDSCSVTLFTATSIPAASQALLEAGEFVGAASHRWLWNVVVTGTTVTLEGCRRGLTVVIQ